MVAWGSDKMGYRSPDLEPVPDKMGYQIPCRGTVAAPWIPWDAVPWGQNIDSDKMGYRILSNAKWWIKMGYRSSLDLVEVT